MRTVLTLIYATVVLAVVVMFYRSPGYNWDMLPYMALVLAHDVPGADSVHALTYATARANLPAGKYGMLVDSTNAYRRLAQHDPQFFASELRLYAVKPLFILALLGFHKLGVPLPKATMVPSLLAYACLGIVVLVWVRRILPEPFATLIALSMMLSPFVLESARASTPDLFTACLLLLGMYLLNEKHLKMPGMMLLLASVFVRLDAALFVLPALVYLRRVGALELRWAVAAFVAVTVASVLILAGQLDAVGQLLVVQFGPERIAPAAEGSFLRLYFHGLAGGLMNLFFSVLFVVLGIACATIFMRLRLGVDLRRDTVTALIAFVLVHIVLRFVLHPSVEDRFVIADYVLVGMAALQTIRGLTDRAAAAAVTAKPTI